MAPHHIAAARTRIKASLLAALNVRPSAPTLTTDELQTLVVGRDGIGVGAFRDAVAQLSRSSFEEDGRARLMSSEVLFFLMASEPVPQELRPIDALNSLRVAFDELENDLGSGAAADRELLHARCKPSSAADVDRGIAMLLACDALVKKSGALARRSGWTRYLASQQGASSRPDVILALSMLSEVRDMFALRAGEHVPALSATERFAVFLEKQGWSQLGSWWSQTVTEMRGLDERSSATSIAVLCGALFEAALVAISKPAREANVWRQRFLSDPPARWKLGALIDQAGESGAFSPNLVAHARTLGDIRNRIHAGRFAKDGTFEPPYTNAHEARIAREHLDLLLVAILEWEVIRPLV